VSYRQNYSDIYIYRSAVQYLLMKANTLYCFECSEGQVISHLLTLFLCPVTMLCNLRSWWFLRGKRMTDSEQITACAVVFDSPWCDCHLHQRGIRCSTVLHRNLTFWISYQFVILYKCKHLSFISSAVSYSHFRVSWFKMHSHVLYWCFGLMHGRRKRGACPLDFEIKLFLSQF